jgi:hypothetical protein
MRDDHATPRDERFHLHTVAAPLVCPSLMVRGFIITIIEGHFCTVHPTMQYRQEDMLPKPQTRLLLILICLHPCHDHDHDHDHDHVRTIQRNQLLQ